MKKKNLFLQSTSSLLAMLFMVMSAFMFTSCNDDDDEDEAEPAPENSILEIVASSESHTQLEAFIEADEDLKDVLGGDNLTVFAPNDEAFDKLRTTLDVESLAQVNPAVIAAVLRFHAVASVERRESFTQQTALTTVQGEGITFNANANIFTGCSNRDVAFVGDEILATNGVVHVVGTILIPPTICATIGENLGKVSQTVLLGADFSILAAAVAKADTYAAETDNVTPLSQILSGAAGPEQITVLAPVNAVFEQGQITLDSYTAQEWYGIIGNHVIGSKELRAEFTYVDENNIVAFSTLVDGTITVVPTGGLDSDGVSGAEANFVGTEGTFDIESENGVVHAIAGVLAPAADGRYAIDAKYRNK